jgi:8-oxo-dGTP pyrophosphatase MutT (NUDIX family)
VSSDRLEPGAELNTGEVVIPRLAATVMLLRGGADRLEVLLAKRTPAARFMGGAWVFPGGSVSAEDGEGAAALRAAAMRELAEEVGVRLPADAELVGFSNWITPAEVRIRFDTWFFLATMPDGQTPQVDGAEIVDSRWATPAGALAAEDRGELSFAFPTRRHLELLCASASAEELLRHTRGRPVRPVQPRVVGTGEQARVVLPGEPGYDD